MIHKHQTFELLQKMVLERVVFTPPLKADGSMHNEACFLYTVNGKSKLYGADINTELNSKDGVIMKCGNYLNSWISSDDEPYEAVAIHFFPEVLKFVFDDKMPEFLQRSKTISGVSIHSVQVDAMIEKYIESLLFYFENPGLVTEELIKLKVKELILLLVNSDSSNKIKTILQDLFNPLEYNFKEIIKKNLFEDLTVEDLAILTNTSLSSFKRKFKEIFGESPARYIKMKRLEKAAHLLKNSSQRITEICYECGFSDIGHFSRSFSNEYGMSPSDYRNN